METKIVTNGNLLIAQPSLFKDIFNRSVVLLVTHNTEGSVGFILNKPTGMGMQAYVSDFPSNFPVYEGGPVEQDNIYYLHSRPDIISESEWVAPNIYWSGNYEDVLKAIKNGWISENEIRFFLGYSGWSANQLKKEVKEKAWHVMRNDIKLFHEWDVELWRNQMTKLGGENLLWLNMPENPEFN